MPGSGQSQRILDHNDGICLTMRDTNQHTCSKAIDIYIHLHIHQPPTITVVGILLANLYLAMVDPAVANDLYG